MRYFYLHHKLNLKPINLPNGVFDFMIGSTHAANGSFVSRESGFGESGSVFTIYLLSLYKIY